MVLELRNGSKQYTVKLLFKDEVIGCLITVSLYFI